MKFNALIPELSVSNLEQSLHFYQNILGFRVEYARPQDKFLFLSLGEAQLMIEEVNENWETGPLDYPYGRGINFQIEVSDIATLIKSVEKAGLSFFRPPEDAWYQVGDCLEGQRQFLIVDPDGYLLRFCQDLGAKPLAKRPGA